jgi:hypothetical protein
MVAQYSKRLDYNLMVIIQEIKYDYLTLNSISNQQTIGFDRDFKRSVAFYNSWGTSVAATTKR